jgi:hypothetical protein
VNISVRELSVVVTHTLRRHLDAGPAEAAARLVVSAEIERSAGLDELEPALADPASLALDGLEADVDGPVARADARGASALVALPGMLDLVGAALHEHGWAVAEVRRVSQPALAPGLERWAGRRGLDARVAVVGTGAGDPTVVLFAAGLGSVGAGDVWHCGRGYEWITDDERASPRERAALWHGIEVDAGRWAALGEFARGLFVEASERSRQDAGPPPESS